MKLHRSIAAAALVLGAVSGAGLVQADDANPALRLTIYANGLTLIDEARTLAGDGTDTVRINGVASTMITDSVHLDTGGAAHVAEFALDSDILSASTLLQRAVGKTIRAIIEETKATIDVGDDGTVAGRDRMHGGFPIAVDKRDDSDAAFAARLHDLVARATPADALDLPITPLPAVAKVDLGFQRADPPAAGARADPVPAELAVIGKFRERRPVHFFRTERRRNQCAAARPS